MSTPVPFDLDPDLLRGKVAVITGSSRGLGAGLAERFADAGVRLGLCARREPTAPKQAAALTGAVDVCNSGLLERFGQAVAQHLGPIDLWINNAAIAGPVGPQRRSRPADVAGALAVNVAGVVNGTRTFTEMSRSWPDGRRILVNMSADAATEIGAGQSIYSATKAAVDHFTEVVAVEEPGLLCYAVAPGAIDTDLRRQLGSAGSDAPVAWSSPEWVADHLLGILAGSLAPERVRYRVPDEPVRR